MIVEPALCDECVAAFTKSTVGSTERRRERLKHPAPCSAHVVWSWRLARGQKVCRTQWALLARRSQRDSEDDWRVSLLALGLRWVMLRLAKTVLRLQEEPRVCNKRCGVGGANRRDTGPSPLLVSFAVLSYQVV